MNTLDGVVVTPFEGVGDILFGSSRDQVTRDRGVPDTSFRRSAWEPHLGDHYERDGVIVSYETGERVAAIELMAPARPVVGGVAVLDHPAPEVLARIRESGLSVLAVDPGTADVPAWGVSLYSPRSLDRADAFFQSISAFAYPLPDAPVVFGAPARAERSRLVIRSGGVGDVALGDPRERIRDAFGEGLATTYGREEMDIFFAGVAVTYAAASRAIRICVTKDGADVDGIPVSVGMRLDDIRAVLESQGYEYVLGRGEIHLADRGIRIGASIAGDLTKQSSSISVAADD